MTVTKINHFYTINAATDELLSHVAKHFAKLGDECKRLIAAFYPVY